MAEWKQRAACAAIADNTFFPDSSSLESAAPALAICEGCPVIRECLEYAQALDIREGIWGGRTPLQRTLDARWARQAELAAEYAAKKHGDYNTAQWERRHGIDICPPCLAAYRERVNTYVHTSRERSRASA